MLLFCCRSGIQTFSARSLRPLSQPSADSSPYAGEPFGEMLFWAALQTFGLFLYGVTTPPATSPYAGEPFGEMLFWAALRAFGFLLYEIYNPPVTPYGVTAPFTQGGLMAKHHTFTNPCRPDLQITSLRASIFFLCSLPEEMI